MKRIVLPLFSLLLSCTVLLSSCKKEEDTPKVIPEPDPTFNFVGDVDYTSTDTEMSIGSFFKVGIVANAGNGKKLVSFVVVRKFDNIADTVVNHSFYAPELSWQENYSARQVSGEEVWTFYIEDENGKSAGLSFVITTIDPKPGIAFITSSEFVSGDTVMVKNTEFMVGINASISESGMELANLRVLRNFEHTGPEMVVDKTVSGQDITWDSTFMTNTYAGDEVWTFIIIDMAGESAGISLLITTEDPLGGDEVVSFLNIDLGSFNDPTYGSFFSTSTGLVYNRDEAGQNQALIDFAFYLGATHGATLGAPSNSDVQAVFDLAAAGWTTFNMTLFKDAPISADEFDTIGSNYTFPPFSGGNDGITQLEHDNVVFFKTHDDKHGYVKVNSINGKGDVINIDVKVEL